MPEFHFNKLYKPVFFTKARYIDIWGGRSRGGSHFATDYFLFLLTQPKYFRGYLMREIFGDIRGSLWRDIKDRIEDNETINPDEFVINDSTMSILHKRTGNIISSKGFKKSSGKQTAKLKSIAGATHVIIEECEEISKEDFEKLDDSLRTTKVDNIQILRLWNPPDINHWLITENFDVHQSGQHPGFYTATPKPGREDKHLSIHSTYLDNIGNINSTLLDKISDYEQKYLHSPEAHIREKVKYPYLVQYLGLIPQMADDVIYKYWDTYETLPPHVDFTVFGIDFGFNDPMVLVEVNVCDSTKEIYVKEHYYKTGQLVSDLAAYITKNIPDYENNYFVYDNAALGHGKDLGSYGVPVTPCNKTDGTGKPSVMFGINKIKEYKYFVHKDSHNVISEKKNYKFTKDKDTGAVMDVPIDEHNHAMDAERYALTKFRR